MGDGHGPPAVRRPQQGPDRPGAAEHLEGRGVPGPHPAGASRTSSSTYEATEPDAKIYFTPAAALLQRHHRLGGRRWQQMVAKQIPVNEGLDKLADSVNRQMHQAGLAQHRRGGLAPPARPGMPPCPTSRSSARRPPPRPAPGFRARCRTSASLPALLVCIGILIPFGTAIWYSLERYNLAMPFTRGFIGLQQYTDPLTDSPFLADRKGLPNLYGEHRNRRAAARPRDRAVAAGEEPAQQRDLASRFCCR